MEITIIDIWLNKIQKYGWKIKDIPKKYKELRKELRRRLKTNESQGRKSASACIENNIRGGRY